MATAQTAIATSILRQDKDKSKKLVQFHKKKKEGINANRSFNYLQLLSQKKKKNYLQLQYHY